MCIQATRRPKSRPGVILLVVMSLLTLFAIVGIAFVIYSQAQANSSRIARQAESITRPDMDPELLLAYFLGQLIYDTDNPHSALRGHSLARTMYGKPGNTLPFNGTGRVHTSPNPAVDDYYQVDYTAYGGVPRNPDQYGSANAPYTYPDFNNMYLAAVRAKDGVVLLPSYYRPNPNTGAPPITLRPSAAYHPAFPPMSDPGGDVKNLADSPGFLIPGGSQLANHDSIWIDLGFPVMKAPDGRKFKPLFAPLIQDLDNRVNVNAHGNWACFHGLNGWNAIPLVSHEGWGTWEVNFNRVISSSNEARNIMRGNGATRGRYDPSFWGGGNLRLHRNYGVRGPSYSQTDYNSLHEWASYKGEGYPQPTNPIIKLPGMDGWTGTFSFPWFHWQFHNAGTQNDDELYSHPRNFNYFSPEQNTMAAVAGQMQKDRVFDACHLEALLRYGDRGSPALSSDLFLLCPKSFADPKTRRLVTTHSFDYLRPGVSATVWDPSTQPYQLLPNQPYPKGDPSQPPSLTNLTPPSGSEFGPNGESLAATLGRIDLNRTIPDYPAVNETTGRITDFAGFGRAQQARQDMAKEIFDVLRKVTGAADPVMNPPPEQLDALRWLAQLAVNCVDYHDKDDYLTPFQWMPGEWVFGTEQPWLVLNEAYVELGNVMSNGQPQSTYQYRFWVELHNPMDGNYYSGNSAAATGGLHPTALTDRVRARLQIAAQGNLKAYAGYQVVVTTAPLDNLPKNSRGDPDPATIKLLVTDYTPEPAPVPQPTVDVKMVRPINPPMVPNPNKFPAPAVRSPTPNGGNEGYYVLGPKDEFPGTDMNRPKATLRVKEQDINGQKNAMAYEVVNPPDLTMALPKHHLLLRQLACPHMPPQLDPALPNYNPYVTVDRMEDVPANDVVEMTNNAKRMPPPAMVADVSKRFSVGRNQPYAAHSSQQVEQKPFTPLVDQPQTTFFRINVQVVDPAQGKEKAGANNQPQRFPFNWLRFADRPLVSSMELLQVPGCMPHELTWQFMTGGTDPATGKPTKTFTHLAPWSDSGARIYRLFEFLEAGTRYQWIPVGGRTPGRINLNTIWDQETFLALCDKQNANFFTDAEIAAIYDKMTRSRSKGPNGTPSFDPNNPDRPFQLAGNSVDDSLFRPDPDDPNERLFNVSKSIDHPHMRTELLRKIFNNLTTRSNVFVLWLTVGFFEVVDDGDATRPPRLGQEIGKAEGRSIRHRMFAVVDRSNLTIAVDPAGMPLRGTPGPRPFFMDAGTAVAAPGLATISLPVLNGMYEDVSWTISKGQQLVVDVGQNMEVVQVIDVVAGTPPKFTANFTKPHPLGFAISNALPGHPGPQPRFDPRNPLYAGLVRYFSIIE